MAIHVCLSSDTKSKITSIMLCADLSATCWLSEFSKMSQITTSLFPAASRAVKSYIVYHIIFDIFDFSQFTPESYDHGRMSAGILSLIETCDKLLPCSGLCLSSQAALSPPSRSQRLGFDRCCKSFMFLFPKSTNHLNVFLASSAAPGYISTPKRSQFPPMRVITITKNANTCSVFLLYGFKIWLYRFMESPIFSLSIMFFVYPKFGFYV